MATSPATFECPSCALDVEAGLAECPYCGYEFPRHRRGVPLVAWLLVALLALGVLAAVL